MAKKWIALLMLIMIHLKQALGIVSTTEICNQELFSLSTTSTWCEYSHHNQHISLCKEKWAWASSLTLKSTHPIRLMTLTLHWNGPTIQNLSAGLYHKKEYEHSVIPIQKNLVCDGTWDAETQKLVFKLDEKIVAVNKYHLLLSFPKHVEAHLKNGKFLIAEMQTSTIDKKYQT